MLSVEIKALLQRLNNYCTSALEGAAGLCVARTHYEVSVEHFLVKLMENPQADLMLIFRHFDIDPGRLRKALESSLAGLKTGNAGKPVFCPLLMQWVQESWLTASVDLDEARIRSGALLAALLNRVNHLANVSYVDIVHGISRDELLAQFWNIVKGSVEKAVKEQTVETGPGPAGEATAIKRFCVDFTAKAASGEIDPVFGRDRQIRQMVDILARRRKNNPIVVGEAGVGKTAVVEGLALRIVEGDVPELLANVSILGLDMGLLQAGAGMKGEFENRLKSVISEIKASETPIILFIDEAHTLIGAGGSAGMSDAANLLKPALARGELRTVAATTWTEYKKYFEKDAALARRFQLVKLDEPSVDTAKLILRGLKEKYETSHNVLVRDDAIEAAAEMSSRYISGRQLPDKAVDLLDTSAARVKVLLSAKPDIIEDKERSMQALDREIAAIGRDKIHGVEVDTQRESDLQQMRRKIETDLENLHTRWRQEQSLANELIETRRQLILSNQEDTGQNPEVLKEQLNHISGRLAGLQQDNPLVRTEVDPDTVAKVVSDWTGIPLGKVMRDQASNIIKLESNLKKRIKGQDQAQSMISQLLKSSKAGVKDPNQPMGVFLLVGPSGVGKTETGLATADLLFGGEEFMVSVNMSEFQEKHTVSRLIGSPPGYVGYGEGGVLTEAVRQRPYSVVLLDEVEKAHLEVLNLFYQVFDKGSLSDGEGRQIDFKNTVLFLTSNLAGDIITEMCSGDTMPDLDVITSAVRPILSNHFKPALLARMTVIPYFTLPVDVLKDIAVLKLEKLVQRLKTSHKMEMTYSDKVIEQIAARCTEVETGARNIDYITNGAIMPRMSHEILTRMGQEQMPAHVYLDLNEQGGFVFDFND
ncbi:MAG: type VI secretion system ATPase TssH [Desulfobacteraceae bacterium]|nr:type VI secretion system ATPase TssH [Desulfobacteraceae bacterium]